jgi:hypothetical protein
VDQTILGKMRGWGEGHGRWMAYAMKSGECVEWFDCATPHPHTHPAPCPPFHPCDGVDDLHACFLLTPPHLPVWYTDVPSTLAGVRCRSTARTPIAQTSAVINLFGTNRNGFVADGKWHCQWVLWQARVVRGVRECVGWGSVCVGAWCGDSTPIPRFGRARACVCVRGMGSACTPPPSHTHTHLC